MSSFTAVPQPPTNIVLITLDCVRPEALSCYSENFSRWKIFPESPETPNIDEIASEGIQYTNAFAQAPFTPGSHASIFTGLNPYNHGIRQIIGNQLANNATTLAERMQDLGYRTAAFIGAHALSSDYGLDRGFEVYDEGFETSSSNWKLGSRRPGEEVTSNALDWLQACEDTQSFLFIHYFDAHDGELPDSRDSPLIGRIRRTLRPIDEYLGRPVEIRKGYGHRFQIRQTIKIDKQIGRLVKYLKKIDSFEDTIFIILADHGDSFGKHNEFNHREYLYDTTIRIPLIFKPDSKMQAHFDTVWGHSTPKVARSIDIFPTLLQRLGLDYDEDSVDGISLISEHDGKVMSYCETRFEEPGTDFEELRHNYVGLQGRRWKLIVDRQTDQRELYNLGIDPDEQVNLYASKGGIARQFEEKLETLLQDQDEDIDTQMDADEMATVSQHLEELGYL